MTTREKILTEALTLFSQRGYDPVSVRDIARAVGIKESSLYNHFRNKQDIFDSILWEYDRRWGEMFRQANLTDDDHEVQVDDRTIAMYRDMTSEQFAAATGMVFDSYMTDEINVKVRRMLTIEQYGSDDLKRLFRKISFDDSLEFQARLFEALIQAGSFIPADPEVMALEFFSPIFLLFYKFDSDPESLQKAKTLFLKHIEQFNKTYGAKGKGEGKA